MTKRKTLIDILSGKGKETINNFSFRIMTLFMNLMDFFSNYSGKNLKNLNLESGQTVIDYGCGPARYLKDASKIVGDTGRVIATDIHPLAIKKAEEKIRKYNLSNVETALATGYNSGIPGNIADVVYALDMFHMIEQPKDFLTELCRLAKDYGRIIIEDGHQPRAETKAKIEDAGVLEIIRETRSYVECRKI